MALLLIGAHQSALIMYRAALEEAGFTVRTESELPCSFDGYEAILCIGPMDACALRARIAQLKRGLRHAALQPATDTKKPLR